MKRILTLILAVMLLAGCQPTPEVDAVRQKNSVKMIEMAKGQATAEPPAGEAEPAATPVPVREQVPERLQWDFYTDVKSIHVTADVPIRIRTEDTFPLLRVKPWTGTNGENLKIVQALLGTDRVYKSVYQVTRADLEKQISDLMNTLSDPFNNKELLEDFGREELEELVPRWQAHLEELQEQYRNFQDDEPQPNPLWDGQPEDDMHQTVLVTGAWDKDNAENYDSVYFFARSSYPEHWSMDSSRPGRRRRRCNRSSLPSWTPRWWTSSGATMPATPTAPTAPSSAGGTWCGSCPSTTARPQAWVWDGCTCSAEIR